ncbi:MAG: DUF368 domain-containing protein [Erysipelotrichaceae bacterium]
MKTIISGIAIGIANIIPGVSGGTMMVVMGMFNKIMESIAGVFKVHNPNRMEELIFLGKILLGAIIGLVGFAKVIEFLFANYEVETMWWFIGMVACSIPVFLKKEIRNDRIRLLPFFIGMLVIFGISYFNPGATDSSLTVFPDVSMVLLLEMFLVGIVAGFTMLLPGVSGSMVLLIIGKYHIFKGYLANVTSFESTVLIPLCVMGIGILMGIVLSAKITKFLLEKNETTRMATLSLILGLVVASSFVLIPLVTYSMNVVLMSALAFVVGGAMVLLLEKLA